MLLRKPRAYCDVYNDLDGEIVNLFRVARDRGEDLVRSIELTPYSRAEFDESFQPDDDPVEQARRTAVRSFMGFGGNLTRQNRDLTPQRTGFRSYTTSRRGSHPCGDWRRWPVELPRLIERLRGIVIEQRDALVCMQHYDAPDALHYVDPPYVHSTRQFDAGGTHRGYRFEMSDQQHRELAQVLRGLQGMVVLSCYASPLYSELFADWPHFDRQHLADGARQRMERLYLNPVCATAPRQRSLIA